MGDELGPRAGAFEEYPLTRGEYITAMAHFYRGELTRAVTWRVRLDTSTNWAIISVMGILTFAFGTPEHSHVGIILGMLFVLHFMLLEAKRYRFFDVWRQRVRMLEENFYGPLLTRDLTSPRQQWGSLVAKDLMTPRFKISYVQALRSRLMSNYATIYGILLLAWIIKVTVHQSTPGVTGMSKLALGPVPWHVPIAVVIVLYAFLVAIALFAPRVGPVGDELWSGADRSVTPMDF